ncbi:MAG: hypothetical protein M3O35_22750 [Acidobacteriota bacterium]|nr:hypothetical protein [Acidobacteriota bacterium]
MSKKHLAPILTVLILAAALGFTLTRNKPQVETSPEDAIYEMLDAAKKGDVPRYLAAYSGPMEASLKQSIAESSPTAFRQYLIDTNATLKGVAVTTAEPPTTREVKLRVEYVYQDRNETQLMYLEKLPPGWKITRAESSQRVKTLVPYGTPVR